MIVGSTFAAAAVLAMGSGAFAQSSPAPSGAPAPYAASPTPGEVPTQNPLPRLVDRQLLVDYALRYVGTPYRYGGESPSGFDCSGYVQYVFSEFGVRVPRTADVQFAAGKIIDGQPLAGDLVFFQTDEPGPSHVGIFIGGGRFVHSASHGVIVSALDEEYYAKRYLGAKSFLYGAAPSDDPVINP